jgi:hypothetical protein
MLVGCQAQRVRVAVRQAFVEQMLASLLPFRVGGTKREIVALSRFVWKSVIWPSGRLV